MVRKIWDTELVTLESLVHEVKIWTIAHWDIILFVFLAAIFSLAIALN